MLNRYETVFIVTPVLSEAQTKEAVIKFKDLIASEGGEIVHEEEWGLRKLAYPIQKKNTGYYYLVEFNAEGSFVDRLETEYRRDERIIRFLTFSLDKHAAAYALKRRANKIESKADTSQTDDPNYQAGKKIGEELILDAIKNKDFTTLKDFAEIAKTFGIGATENQ